MAASRKLRSVDTGLLAPLRGKRLAVGFSGGIDSTVLLHALHCLQPEFGYRLSAVHVNHGLSQNAGEWERFCRAFCLDLEIPLRIFKVKVSRQRKGLEAAARDARRAALGKAPVDAIALAHHLDDQAETVLLNLLRGAGIEGASGMQAQSRLGKKRLLRPLLGISRADIAAYAAEHRLGWINDESNADTALTRNFLRHRVGPVLESRFPRWREALARAARHFAGAQLDASKLLRAWLKEQGLRSPSEAKLGEMLKQMSAGRGSIEHEGTVLRFYREDIFAGGKTKESAFKPRTWHGQARLELPALGGELRFKRVRGRGIDRNLLKTGKFEVRLRSGGERLQSDAKRPRRTLKNLFQEAGVPPWERERLPLLYCGNELVWAPGLGVDVKFLAPSRANGVLPEWNARPGVQPLGRGVN
jgi:tRNA(Ile)-lysidine synthase